MFTCNIMHYIFDDPENGPAGSCILEKGHTGFHEHVAIGCCDDGSCYDCILIEKMFLYVHS